MRIGLIGKPRDPHLRRLTDVLEALGAEPVAIDASTFDEAHRFAFDGPHPTYQGRSLADVPVFYLRSVLSPVPEVYVEDGEFRFYEDWHQRYMAARERHGFLLAWMLSLLDNGQRLVNPPREATISLLKPYQLSRLQRLGFPTPRSLTTNDPAEARAFVEAVGDAVCKPVMGGAFCERVTPELLDKLPLISKSPVLFQERLDGPDIRVTAVRGKVLSAVAIESDQTDFRATDAYLAGAEHYTPVTLPKAVSEMCYQAMEATDLYVSGLDLKRTGPDTYVLLEANYSPAWAGIEAKTGHPIAEGIARYLLHLAKLPRPAAPGLAYGPTADGRRPAEAFFHYGLPKPSDVLGR